MQTNNFDRNGHIDDLIANVMSLRRDWFRNFTDPRRDIDDECGFPKNPDAQVYQDLYNRDAIAARVVECLPFESWQVQPLVYESESARKVTKFEQAWDDLGRDLRGGWFQDEQGSPVWEYLKRADVLSGVGQYGVILLGLDDLQEGDDLRKPAEPAAGRRLLFMRVFPQVLAPITRFDLNITSPRYGQPQEYNLTFNDWHDNTEGAIGLSAAMQPVHWSRVVHIADCLRSSEIFGIERMRPVLNNILSLRKVLGASAEGYWKSCFTGISFETNPQLGGDVKVNRDDLRDMWEQYQNGLQRALFLMGMNAKTLAPTVVDPSPHVAAQLEAICVKLGIPVRIFKGSERGELASSQDDDAWNDRLRQRQHDYITPRIVVPFVNRLIQLGILPTPKGFSVEWPDLTSTSADQRAATFQKRMAGLAAYVSGQVDQVIRPMDLLTRELDYTEEEAEAILKAAAKEASDDDTADDETQPDDNQPQQPEEESDE